MKIDILYFASLREGLGLDRERVDLPPEVGSVGALRAWLRERGGAWAELLSEDRAVRAALGQRMTTADAALSDGVEVAFFPPVTGG